MRDSVSGVVRSVLLRITTSEPAICLVREVEL